MSQELVLKNTGLATNPNQLSLVPAGALTIASNVNIDKDGVAEPRRGFGRIPAPADTLMRNDRITSYQDKLIVHRGNDNSMAHFDGADWIDYLGDFEHPNASLARMQFNHSNGNLYFTTKNGVKVLDSYAAPVYSTGMPRALDGSAATTGASGFMADDKQVAYRIVWGSRDANNNLYLGTPSQRIIVANTSGGTRDVALTATIPAGISVDDFYQVYRSKESATASDEPNDELQLIYEKNPTSGEIAAKTFTFTDSTPVSLMGASLYTNASQEGISESNDEPPFANDITSFKNFMFFAGVESKYKLNIKLLAVDGAAGIAITDTITIDGDVYAGAAAEDVPNGKFQVFTAGSASQNISDTAQSLVKVINQFPSNNGIYAYYVSGYQDLPGQVLVMSRTFSASVFTVTVNKASAWDIGTGEASNETFQNGLMWSKNQQPEHVPSAHLEFVGSKNYPIRRIIPLRDSLFILKTDGVFRLTGSGGSWSIEPLDTSTKIIAPDSAAVVNNQIFCLADQGVVAISDVGVQVMSRPIEDEINTLISYNFELLKTLSFGVAYETDRKYILHTISTKSDVYPTMGFVYNTFTQAWTTWKKNASHAFVAPIDDRIYLCNPSDQYILAERKSLTFQDYIDEEVDGIEIVSSEDHTLMLNTTAGIDVGYLIKASESVYSVVMEVNSASDSVLVNDLKVWPTGPVSVYQAIPSEIEYVAQHFKNPGVMKHFQEVALLFRESNFINGTISFFTDLSGGYSNTLFVGNYGSDFWGLFKWGAIPWGGATRPKPIRSFVPREKSRGTIISVKIKIANAYSKWSLNGISLQYEWVSERTSRS
ncbi:hypothetical protein [Bdellovibrio sp. HCB288]|uniref:hypothetical protein n=1 Tax=Bdellovibrio sp. HCB288 TaxID=3394355 RepID=UPI0039B3CC61